MIFRITFKDPDGVSEGYAEVVRTIQDKNQLSSEEDEYLYDHRLSQARELTSSWIKWDEYITIEFDSVKKTATVVKNKE